MSGELAIVSQSGESINFYDISSGEKTGHIDSLTAEPHELCFDAKRKLLYCSHAYHYGHYWKHGQNGHEISIIDTTTKKVVGTIDTRPARAPHGLILDNQGITLYASVEELPDNEGGGLIAIDLVSRKIVKTVASSSKPHWVVITKDAKKAYTCNKDSLFVSVLDLENERMVGKVDVPSCEQGSLSPDGRHAYFPSPSLKFGKNPADPRIIVVDTAIDQIVGDIKLERGALPTHVTSQGMILAGEYTYADEANGKKNAAWLAMYHPVTLKQIGAVEAGLWPLTIHSSPDGKTAMLSNTLDGTVSIVDLASRKEIKLLTVDPIQREGEEKSYHVGAHGMAFIGGKCGHGRE